MRRNLTRGRRLIIAALVAAVLAVVTACSDSGGVGGLENAEQDTSGGPVTLQYWTWFPPEATVKELIAAYEKANPDITIELHQYAGGDYRKSAQLALNSGEQIDILGVQVAAMTKDASATVRPVKEWAEHLPDDWESQLRTEPMDQVREAAEDGELYELPMGSMGSVVMFYNAALLDELGIEPPTTAAELTEASKKIRAAKPDITPAVFIGEPYWQLEMLWTIIGQTNPELSDQVAYEGTAWTDPQIVQGIADYKALFTSGAFDTSTLSLKAPRPVELFGSGKAAFLFDGSWRSALLSADYRKENELKVKDVGALPFPIVREGGEAAVRTGAEGGLAIPKSSTHVKEAADFIAWMTMGDGADLWGEQLLLVPAKKSFALPDGVLQSPAAQAGYDAIQSVLQQPSSNRAPAGGNDFNDVGGNGVLDVLNGNKTPEAATADIQAEWTSGRFPHPGDDK